jgi:tetratricopeptide (TPR) repeat protein
MITMSDVAAPSERPLAPDTAVPVTAVHGRQKGTRARALAGTCLLVGLTAFNAWWYWRETRPLPDVNSISDWMRREQYTRSETALREQLRRSPHDGEARMMLARVLALRGNLLGCARELHEVPFWWPRKAEALYREGQSYMMIDRAKDAEAAWLELIKDDPLHPVSTDLLHDACQEMLKLYAIEDRWEDAYPVIWTAYDHADAVDHPFLLAMRMRSELERVAPTESIGILKRYIAATADDWEALRALARAELALGLRAEAASHFQACLKGLPDDVRAWRDYLTMLLEQGDLDAFLALLEKAPKSAESEPETWMFRGVAREKTGDWQAAAESFHKAIALNPYIPKYYYRLAMTEEHLGLREEALGHRGRTKEMNEARAQLPVAYSDYFAAREPVKPGAPEMAATCEHLAAICQTLGWSRAAQAWSSLAVSP